MSWSKVLIKAARNNKRRPIATNGGMIDKDRMKREIGPVCQNCGLPGAHHFRGNGSRFVGCTGAQVKR